MCTLIRLAPVLLLTLALGITSPPRATTSTAPTIDAVWGGDVMLGRGVGRAWRGGPAFRADAWHPFDGLQTSLAAADLRVANLESPLTVQPRLDPGPYALHAPPSHVAALTRAGFDALATANNHALDHGPAGLRETLTTLREAGIVPLGAGEDAAAAYQPRLLRRAGLSVALLAFDGTGTPPRLTAAGSGPTIARLSPTHAEAAVRRARRRADLVVVQVHWGVEYRATPSAAQRALARRLVAAGADAVIGHHPHVVGPSEWLPRPERRPALVAYSLGNLLFDAVTPETQRGVLLLTRLDRRGVVHAAALPVHTDARGSRPLPPGPAREAVLARLGLPGL